MEIIKKHKDNYGRSLMHSAALSFSPHMVTIFNKLGCQFEVRDDNGERALDYIRNIPEGGKAEAKLGTIYALLCAMSGEEFDNESVNKCIHLAIKMGEDEIAKELIEKGLSGQKDEEDNCAIHLVIKNNNLNLLRTLLAKSSNYDPQNIDGDTPLHLSESDKAMKMIFDAAIGVVTENELLSIRNGNSEPVLHRLVVRSEGLNLRLAGPVKYALDSGAVKEEVVKGGKNNGNNAIDIARRISNKGIENLLKTHKPNKRDMEVRQQIRDRNRKRKEEYEKDKKGFMDVLNKDKDINSELSESGRYAIHFAIERNDVYLIRELVKRGAKLDLEYKGTNSYKLAINEGFYESLECLLSLGDVIDTDSRNESVLEIAIEKGGKCADIVLEALPKSKCIESKASYVVEALKILIKRTGTDDNLLDKVEKLLMSIKGVKVILNEGRTLLLEIIKLKQIGIGMFEAILNSREVKEVFVKDRNGNSVLDEIVSFNDTRYLSKVLEALERCDSEEKDQHSQYLLNEIHERTEELIVNNRKEHLLLVFRKYREGHLIDKIKNKTRDLAIKRNDRHLLKKIDEINLENPKYTCITAVKENNYELLSESLKSTDVLETNGNNKSILELAVEKGDKCMKVALEALPLSKFKEERTENILKALKILIEEDRASSSIIKQFFKYVENKQLKLKEGELFLINLLNTCIIPVEVFEQILEIRGTEELFEEDREGNSILWKILLMKSKTESLRNLMLNKIYEFEEYTNRFLSILKRKTNYMMANGMEGTLLTLLDRYNKKDSVKSVKQSALRLAIDSTQLAIIKHLSNLGVSLDEEDQNGSNIYRLAIENERYNSFTTLLEIGDILDTDGKGESVLEIVLKKKNLKLSKSAMSALNNSKKIKESTFSLVRALKIQIEQFLEEKLSVNYIETLFDYLKGQNLELDEGYLLLTYLVESKKLTIEVLNIIIKQRGIKELFKEENKEALSEILLMNRPDYLLKIIEQIDENPEYRDNLSDKIESDAENFYNRNRLDHLIIAIEKLKVSDKLKQYALYLAIKQSKEDKIERSINLGARINQEDKDGINSYRLAIQENRYLSFSKLLELGDVLDRDNGGESVLEMALKKGEKYAESAVLALREYKNDEKVTTFIAQMKNQTVLNKLETLGFKVKTNNKQAKSYEEAIEEADYDLLASLINEGDVLDSIDTESKTKSVLELAVSKGGQCSYVALKALNRSVHKKERYFYIIEAFEIIINRGGPREDLIKKIEMLLTNLPKESELKLLRKLFEEQKLKVDLFKKIIEVRGPGEVFKDYNEILLQKVITMEKSEYLEELIKAIEADKDRENCVKKLLSQTEISLKEPLKENKLNNLSIDNLKIILDEYGDKFMSDKSREQMLGKLIYIAAKEEKEDMVKLLLGNFVSFVTKRDLTMDKWRTRLSQLIKLAGENAGFPGAGLAGGIIGELVKPKERKEGTDEIMYIDKLYREGAWADGIKIKGRKSLLKYFVESAKAFKEMSRVKLEERINSKFSREVKSVKEWMKKEVGKISSCYITKEILNVKNKSKELAKGPEREAYKLKIKEKLDEILEELEKYNETHKTYASFIEEKITGVLKEKLDWKDTMRKELEDNYKKIMNARMKLMTKVTIYKEEASKL